MDSLQKKDHNQLWLGLQNDKFDQFWSVNKKLMESSEKPFNFIPFRLLTSDTRQPTIQKLVKPFNKETGDPVTLGDFLNDLKLQPSPGTAKELVNYVILHGIEPPPETPLQWLSEHMSYPDNFLYLCLRSRELQVDPISRPSSQIATETDASTSSV